MGREPAHGAGDLSTCAGLCEPSPAAVAFRGGNLRRARSGRGHIREGGANRRGLPAGGGGGCMRGARGWIVATVIAILIAAAAYLLQPKQDSPEHSTNSDAVNGASAALLYAQAMGHPADQITGSFAPPQPYSMMFVFTPTSPYTAEEAANTADWVRFGGVLVYASEQGDPQL